MKKFLVILLLPLCAAAKDRSPKEEISHFYTLYLNAKSEPERRKLHLNFSKAFDKAVSDLSNRCKKGMGSDICGWGADGDVYLNSQEWDPKLRFKSAKPKFTETEPGKVLAEFNVFPSEKTNPHFYDRKITFVMVKEQNRWVVDDMLYDGKSERSEMEKQAR